MGGQSRSLAGMMGALSEFGSELRSSCFFGQLWFLIGSSRDGIGYEEVGGSSCSRLISFFRWLGQTLKLIFRFSICWGRNWDRYNLTHKPILLPDLPIENNNLQKKQGGYWLEPHILKWTTFQAWGPISPQSPLLKETPIKPGGDLNLIRRRDGSHVSDGRRTF